MIKEHIGSNFDDFLKEEGILEETEKKVKEEMNKPIIIDGVDVSECEYRTDIHKELLADGKIKIFENYCQICNDGCYAIDCYYKQLQRMKEENDGLKSQLDFEIQKRETVEAENEGLNRLTGIYSFRQMKKYKQALEEVREIAYTTDFDIRDIQKIVNKVLKDE